jgi:two-component system, NarL family, response regulator NreC
MRSKQTIIIADTHSIHRAGLKALLEIQGDFEVIGEADNGSDAIRQIAKLKPDLLISELNLPGLSGIDILRVVQEKGLSVKSLLLTMYSDEEEIRASLDAGADGFVMMDATPTELIKAVQQVLGGKTYLGRDITDLLVDRLVRAKHKRPQSGDLLKSITSRETQVLQLIAEGHTNKSMAERLSLSVKTVEKYRANLMKKLNLSSVPELTKYALRKGIIRPSHNMVAASTSAA